MKHLTRDRFVNRPDRELRLASLLAMRARRTPADLADVRRLVGHQRSEWLEFGRRNRIGSLVASTMLETWGTDDPEADRWHQEYDATERYLETLMHELDLVAGELDAQGVRVVAMKNAGIARGLHPHLGECPMGDLDLLVRRDQLLIAHDVMIQLGYEHATRAPLVEPADLDHALASGGAEYRAQRDGHEVWVEVQWRPIAGRWIPQSVEPKGEELLDRSLPILGSHARLLEPTDNMIQVALHTAKHTYCRAPGLRLHTDVDRLVAHAPPDWEALVQMASSLRLKTAIYFSLALPHALLDTPVPEWVLDSLSPAVVKVASMSGWLAHEDIFEPNQRKFGRAGMTMFHGFLFDSMTDALGAALGVDRGSLTIRNAPEKLQAGVRRAFDLIGRYEQ